MSNVQYLSDRAKFGYILQLSKDQIRALETNDIATFNKVLIAKRTLIGSLGNCRTLIANDSSLSSIVNQINDSERLTEKLLFRRIGRIKRELDEIHQFNNAKRAYRKIDVKTPAFVRDPKHSTDV